MRYDWLPLSGYWPANLIKEKKRVAVERLFCEYGGFEMKLKSVLTTSAAAAALLAAGSANAAGYYLGLFGGISTWEDDFNPRIYTASSSAGTFVIPLGGPLYLTTTDGKGGGPKTSKNSYVGYTLQVYKGLTTVKTQTSKTATATWGPYTGVFGVGIRYASFTFSSLTWNEGVDDGWVIGAALGWDFGTGFRTELELAYRSNDIDSNANGSFYQFASSYYAYAYGIVTYVTPVFGFYYYMATFPTKSATNVIVSNTGTTTTVTGVMQTSGDIETWSLMANLWYDFNLGDSPIVPFIGGGIGLAQVNMDYQALVYMPANSTTASASGFYLYTADTDDFAFAYQVGAGLGFNFGNGMMLSAQYRYFATGEVQLGRQDQFSGNVESHNFLLGLNIPLGQQ